MSTKKWVILILPKPQDFDLKDKTEKVSKNFCLVLKNIYNNVENGFRWFCCRGLQRSLNQVLPLPYNDETKLTVCDCMVRTSEFIFEPQNKTACLQFGVQNCYFKSTVNSLEKCTKFPGMVQIM